jgi:hypothetical protein
MRPENARADVPVLDGSLNLGLEPELTQEFRRVRLGAISYRDGRVFLDLPETIGARDTFPHEDLLSLLGSIDALNGQRK